MDTATRASEVFWLSGGLVLLDSHTEVSAPALRPGLFQRAILFAAPPREAGCAGGCRPHDADHQSPSTQDRYTPNRSCRTERGESL